MSPAEHVRASTEPGPLGLLLWAVVIGASVIASAIVSGANCPQVVTDHPMIFGWLAFAAVVLAALGVACYNAPLVECADCMVGQGRQCKCREALSTDIEPWHLPHMNNQPNDGGA
jgi:hypothetical protein